MKPKPWFSPRATTALLLSIVPIAHAADLLRAGDTIFGGRVNGTVFEVGVVGTVAGANNWPGNEAPANAIDGVGQKYLNFAELSTGVVVTPSVGPSVATSMRLWTANDAVDRDPATFELYGTTVPLVTGPFAMSNFTLIASGDLALPASRNTGGGAVLDNANSQEVVFPTNGNVYSSYLIVFPTVKNSAAANSMQIAEIELDGIIGTLDDTDGDGLSDAYETANGLDPDDNGLNPNNNGVPGNPDNGADGDPDMDTLTNLEERDLGTDPQDDDTDDDGYTDNVEDDGGVWVSASQTGSSPLDPDTDNDTLLDGVENPDLPFDPLNPLTQPGTDPNLADTDGDTVRDAVEIAAGRDPTVAEPLPPAIIMPGDPILGGQIINNAFAVGAVGDDLAGNAWPAAEEPRFAIDGFGQKYLNFGNLNTGVLVTPSVGPSVATGMVLWTANDSVDRDPASYELYGTNDDITGTGPFPLAQFTLISSGDLNLPDSRNLGGIAPLDPINSETLFFSNSASYTSYLILFPTIKNNGTANSMQIAEIQVNGSLGSSDPFALDIRNDGNDLLFIFSSRAGRLYDILSTTNPAAEPDPASWAVWQADLPASPPENTEIFARPADPARFFVVREKEAPPFFLEDFESGQGAWTTGVADIFGNTQWILGTPAGSSGPTTGADGSANAFSTNLGDYGIDSDIFLRSPVLDLTAPGLTGATLHMDQFRDADALMDTGTIRVLRAGDLAPLGSPIDADLLMLDTDWTAFSAPLPPEALGQMVILEFRFVSDDSDDFFSGWSIDNVEVEIE